MPGSPNKKKHGGELTEGRGNGPAAGTPQCHVCKQDLASLPPGVAANIFFLQPEQTLSRYMMFLIIIYHFKVAKCIENRNVSVLVCLAIQEPLPLQILFAPLFIANM